MPEELPGAGRVTIYDVAAAAGVSASTVSRAFARPGRVSYETAQRIRAVAAELGYRQVELRVEASGVRSGAGMVALSMADVSNPVFFDIIRGAEEEASRSGRMLVLVHTRESAEVEKETLVRLLDRVEAFVLATPRMSDASIRMIAKQRPTATLNRGVPGVPCVVADNARGMRRVLEHLGELGHSDVVYLAGPEASWANGVRWRALREGAHELGMSVSQLQAPQPTFEAGETMVESVFKGTATAVVCYNDLLALGFIRRSDELGHPVPESVSVVGFDNTLMARLARPALTSVASPLHALGATAVRNLLDDGHDQERDRLKPVVLPMRLVIRESTAAARRATEGN